MKTFLPLCLQLPHKFLLLCQRLWWSNPRVKLDDAMVWEHLIGPSSSVRLRLLSVDPIKAKDSLVIALEQLKLSGLYPSSSVRLRLLSVDPIKAKDSLVIALEQLKLSGRYLLHFLLCEAASPLCGSHQGQGQPRHCAGAAQALRSVPPPPPHLQI